MTKEIAFASRILIFQHAINTYFPSLEQIELKNNIKKRCKKAGKHFDFFLNFMHFPLIFYRFLADFSNFNDLHILHFYIFLTGALLGAVSRAHCDLYCQPGTFASLKDGNSEHNF